LTDKKIQGKLALKEILEKHPEWLELIDKTINAKDIQEVVDEDTLAKANEVAAKSEE